MMDMEANFPSVRAAMASRIQSSRSITKMTTNNNKESINGRSKLFTVRDRLFYLMVGGGIGAAAGVMLAPKSGADLRRRYFRLFRKKGMDQAKDLAANLKEQSTGAYQSIREKAESAYDLAASKMARVQEAIDNSTTAAAQHINSEILEGSNSRSERSLTSGRKSSNIV